MIEFSSVPLKKSINKAYLKVKPVREDFEKFKEELKKLLTLINFKESEEHNKNFIRDFLKNTFYSDKFVNTKGKTDLAIHLEKSSKSAVGVIIETKSPAIKSDMISENNLNCKAMHEVILYYLRERIEQKNDEIKNIIITNAYKWFIFKADQFEKHFYKSKLKNEYEKWRDDKKVSRLNEHFYNEIVKKFLDETDTEIEAIYFDLRDFEKYLNKEDEKQLIPLLKKFSPPELLKESFANDSNTLNKQFYSELLHIIGLEEYKEKSKKKIRRKDEKNRDNGSLLENTIRMIKSKDVLKKFDDIAVYGDTEDEQLYNTALELNIIWINRVIFIKLLEAQLVNYHTGDKNYKFLEPKVIQQYDDLFELFHEVLAVKTSDRNPDLIGKFNKIPYLNSSLFELSEIEKKTIDISGLKDRFNLPFYKSTVFSKDIKSKGELPALEYLLLFLDAYDFASESGEEILEERKTIMNASVLGLIFEKINGYKEGSFYTPGFITMYMARETLRRAVVQKFNDEKGSSYKDYEELKRNIDTSSRGREEANKIINELKICDPAVGSGHFLVSCLNEIIAIKADLKVLNYRDGRQVQNYSFEIENDELVITNEETDELFDYHLNPSDKPITTLHELQEALFHEKETLIENCLFGVDINPNSVNICRLRLWIELLKNSYYTSESNYTELETLPNIDINIKQGNSLISRFDVRQDIFTHADKQTLDIYKLNVALYKNEQDKNKRRELKDSIEKTKERFRGIAVDPLKKEREQIDKLTEKLHKLNTDSLFDGNISREEQEKIEKKRNELVEKINKLTEQKSKKAEEYQKLYANAFEWRFEYPEVLVDEGNFKGFDIVIGNPPWGIDFRKEALKLIKENCKDIIVRMVDSFMFFINRSFELWNGNGLISMIVPDVLLYQVDNQKLREKILMNYSLDNVVNLGDKLFEDVARPSAIFILSNNSYDKTMVADYSKIKEKKIIKSEFLKVETSLFLKLPYKLFATSNFDGYKILSRIKGNKLSFFVDEYGIQRGVSPDLKEAFIINKLIAEKFDLEKEKLKPTITGGVDLIKYQILDVDKVLIYTSSDDDFISVPNIVRFINSFKDSITCKEVSEGKHPLYSLHRARKEKIFLKPEKIIGVITGDKIVVALDDKQRYPTDGLYLFNCDKIENKFITGLLNSRLLTYFYRLLSLEEGRTLAQIKPTVLEDLPIVNANKEESKTITSKVDEILKLKKQNPKADTVALEKEINQMIYKLYRLTEEERKIVEKSFNK